MADSSFSEGGQLVLVFSAWKALLFLLTAFCPGPGYDTSGLILADPSATRYANLELSNRFDRFTLNLLRWDALYFVKAAERGVVFEQEWAFSPTFSRLMGVTGRCEMP
jgi:phosphatidylinositol glycan class V